MVLCIYQNCMSSEPVIFVQCLVQLKTQKTSYICSLVLFLLTLDAVSTGKALIKCWCALLLLLQGCLGGITTCSKRHVGSNRTRSCGLCDIGAFNPDPHKWRSAFSTARQVSWSHPGLVFMNNFHLSHSQTWSNTAKLGKDVYHQLSLCCLVVFIIES